MLLPSVPAVSAPGGDRRYHPKSVELRNSWKCCCYQTIARQIPSAYRPFIGFPDGRRYLSGALQGQHNAPTGPVAGFFGLTGSRKNGAAPATTLLAEAPVAGKSPYEVDPYLCASRLRTQSGLDYVLGRSTTGNLSCVSQSPAPLSFFAVDGNGVARPIITHE